MNGLLFRVWKFVLGCTLVVCITLLPRVCPADEAPDKAAAEALYQLGQQLMKTGDYAGACPKLEASHALEPGVGTLLLLGDCREKLGKLASAWATFREAAELASSHADPERARMAELRAAALKPRVGNVVYKVAPSNDIEGFELRRNGVVVAKGSWGVSLPTDSGSYELVASAPNHESWRTTLEVPSRPGGPLVVQVPPLRAVTGPATANDSKSTFTTASVERSGSTGSGQKTLGIVVGAVGVAAVITSGVLAFLASEKNDESKSDCASANPNLCNPQGVSKRDDAKSMAALATVFGIGGGVALATGTVLYLTAPRAESGHMTGLTLGLRGTF